MSNFQSYLVTSCLASSLVFTRCLLSYLDLWHCPYRTLHSRTRPFSKLSKFEIHISVCTCLHRLLSRSDSWSSVVFFVSILCHVLGAELYLPELRSIFKRILWVTGLMSLFTFLLVSIAWWGVSQAGLVSWATSYESSCQYSMGMIASSIMIERSWLLSRLLCFIDSNDVLGLLLL